jgi:hypothetical protein
MGADVEPAVHKIEADPMHQGHGDLALNIDRERTGRARQQRQRRLASEDVLEKTREKTRYFVEHQVYRRYRPARLVLVEERLVGAGPEPIGLDRGDVALHTEHLFQTREHSGEVALRPGLAQTISHSEQARDSASISAPGTAAACA